MAIIITRLHSALRSHSVVAVLWNPNPPRGKLELEEHFYCGHKQFKLNFAKRRKTEFYCGISPISNPSIEWTKANSDSSLRQHPPTHSLATLITVLLLNSSALLLIKLQKRAPSSNYFVPDSLPGNRFVAQPTTLLRKYIWPTNLDRFASKLSYYDCLFYGNFAWRRNRNPSLYSERSDP